MPRSSALLVFALVVGALFAGCGSSSSGDGGGDDAITSCSPFGAKICSHNKLYECRGPGTAGGDDDGAGVLIDDCAAASKICDEFSNTCLTKEAYCKKGISPTPPECK